MCVVQLVTALPWYRHMLEENTKQFIETVQAYELFSGISKHGLPMLYDIKGSCHAQCERLLRLQSELRAMRKTKTPAMLAFHNTQLDRIGCD